MRDNIPRIEYCTCILASNHALSLYDPLSLHFSSIMQRKLGLFEQTNEMSLLGWHIIALLGVGLWSLARHVE